MAMSGTSQSGGFWEADGGSCSSHPSNFSQDLSQDFANAQDNFESESEAKSRDQCLFWSNQIEGFGRTNKYERIKCLGVVGLLFVEMIDRRSSEVRRCASSR